MNLERNTLIAEQQLGRCLAQTGSHHNQDDAGAQIPETRLALIDPIFMKVNRNLQVSREVIVGWAHLANDGERNVISACRVEWTVRPSFGSLFCKQTFMH